MSNAAAFSQQGEHLAAVAIRRLGGGLAASYVAAWLNGPIVIAMAKN
jgi:hypothetical protein